MLPPRSFERRSLEGRSSIRWTARRFGRFLSLQVVSLISWLLFPLGIQAQQGNLQIHFINVGQGDAALLISPTGETVLFDNGDYRNCDLPISYLDQLGIGTINYHVASHYHSDHIGCTEDVLGKKFSGKAIDHGGDYHTDTYRRYEKTVKTDRTAAQDLRRLLLGDSSNPVVIDFVISAGIAVEQGKQFTVNNENDLSVVSLVRYGDFSATFGGDLSGEKTSNYRDVETPAAHLFSQIEVYKVHHHGSRHSSNDAWLASTKPMIAIISAGVRNTHGHPTVATLKRLHTRGIRTYWTTTGSGDAAPQLGLDTVGGNIIIEVEPNSETFSVTHSGDKIDTFTMWESKPPVSEKEPLAWSIRSSFYHYRNCLYVRNISPQNINEGDMPPDGKELHVGCPR